MLWNSLGVFFKTCLKIPQLLPTFKKVTFVTHEIYALFAIFNNKDLGLDKSEQIIVY